MAGAVKLRTSSSLNHFLDTNVLLQHANSDSGDCSADIATILAEAAGNSPKRKLWVSSAIFAELRPSAFVPGKFDNIDGLVRYIRSIATVVTPDPNAMLRAARLRDLKWARAQRQQNELSRCMTLGDAMHIVSALWVKEADSVADLEFLTFDNSADKSIETDPKTKALPLLSLDDGRVPDGGVAPEGHHDAGLAGLVRRPRLAG